jgi:hypothetical protein
VSDHVVWEMRTDRPARKTVAALTGSCICHGQGHAMSCHATRMYQFKKSKTFLRTAVVAVSVGLLVGVA